MAVPLTVTALLAALRAEGVQVAEHPGWRTHNRAGHGPWGPAHGVMLHHTGPYRTEEAMVQLCYDGYEGLPGPLGHGVIRRDGVLVMVGHGRANHAGKGDPDVLRAVIAERALPADDQATIDGNAHFYGFEAINDGAGRPWPSEQIMAMVRVSAAICRAHGWGDASVIGHKEWQPGKPDPASLVMSTIRELVGDCLVLPAGRWKRPGGPPGPPRTVEERLEALEGRVRALEED